MKILLVEDVEDKREQIMEFVLENIDCEMVEVRSFHSGLKAIKESQFDLILLDMTIPTYDFTATESGGRSQSFGGRLLLYEMVRRGILSKVIIVTQFDLFGEGEDEISISDLSQQLQEQFPENYLGTVQYNIQDLSWKEPLLHLLNSNQK